ncbi:MAG TPA: hypothetical protein VNZ26_11345 [Vicinamibacterales bacterium]|nr:hypothetical protein [Vicinamibacterales bacterium]
MIRLAIIVFIIAVDDLAREVKESVTTTHEFITHRVRWIVLEKWRSIWRRAR